MKVSKYVNLSDIVVPKCFAKTFVKEDRIKQCIEFYNEHGCFDKPIVLDNDNVIVDSYYRYLAACYLGLSRVPCIYKNTDDNNNYFSYVTARFPNHEKEYVWKNVDKIPLNIGDFVIVLTKKHIKRKPDYRIMVVTNTFISNDENLANDKIVGVLK